MGSSRPRTAKPTLPNEPGENPAVALAPDPTGLSLPIVLSGTLLIIGLGLFAMRWSARRFGG